MRRRAGMERSDIACQRQPEGQRRGALATVDDTTDAMRAVACIRVVRLVVVVHGSEVAPEARCAGRDEDKMDDLPADPMKSQRTEDHDGYDHHSRGHRDGIPESKRLLLVGGNSNTRGLFGVLPSLIRPPEQVDQS